MMNKPKTAQRSEKISMAAKFPAQILSALIGRLYIARSKTFRGNQRAAKGQLQRQFPLQPRGAGGQTIDACESCPQVRDGFDVGRACGRHPASPQPIPDRLFRKSRLAKVTGDKFRLRVKRLSEARFNGVGYAGVQ